MPDSKVFTYEMEAADGKARAGVFHTPHGDIPTPIFAPVGTQATVKAVTPAQLSELGCSLVLANTYHLFLRPGPDLVAEMGGLHEFMQWHGPMLTDSGGFQVFSLGPLRKIDEDGVTFKSYIDGSMHRLTPETSIEVQEKLGADIIMAFDECADPFDHEYNKRAMERTHRWLDRCVEAKKRPDQALFGIVQGGIFADLREASAKEVSSHDLPGFAIGGLSVGESKKDMNLMMDLVTDILPEDKPRYLMGVGSPEDLVNGIQRGIDFFDCVLPTRLARHGAAMTFEGRMNMINQQYISSRAVSATPVSISPGLTSGTCCSTKRSWAPPCFPSTTSTHWRNWCAPPGSGSSKALTTASLRSSSPTTRPAGFDLKHNGTFLVRHRLL